MAHCPRCAYFLQIEVAGELTMHCLCGSPIYITAAKISTRPQADGDVTLL